MNALIKRPDEHVTRSRLLKLRRTYLTDLRADLHDVLADVGAADDAADDFERSADALREEELALKVARVEQRTAGLAGIKAALSALDNGTYGMCFDCGEAIETKRLDSNPIANRCLTCAENHEKTTA